MVSHAGTTFAEGMSYRREHGFLPGVSVFRRQIGRTLPCCAVLPGDCFCDMWHFLDLIPEGAAGSRNTNMGDADAELRQPLSRSISAMAAAAGARTLPS
jgi:hypothetical protein